MDNPEKLATLGTQDEHKQNKISTICVGHHYAQTKNVEVIVFIIILGTQKYNASSNEVAKMQDN